MIFVRVVPFELKKKKLSVSVLLHLKICIYKAGFPYLAFLLENAGKFRIWFRPIILDKFMLLKLKKKFLSYFLTF